MIINAIELAEKVQPHVQTIVVGGGAVGLSMAVDLARAGHSVTVLEAGPITVTRSSQKYFEDAVNVGLPLQGLHHGRFRALGGTTNFWGGQLVPFDPIVFSERHWLAEDSSWPISRNDLDRYYDRAIALLGMGKAIMDDTLVMQRMGIVPPVSSKYVEYFFTRWLPEPNFAILFRDELTNLPQLRVVTGAVVSSFVMEEGGDERLSGVTVVDENGRLMQFSADRVVLANGTIEIARLLSVPLSNGNDATWSTNPWLGRGFMDHIDCDVGILHPANKKKFHDLFDNILIDRVKYSPKLKLGEAGQEELRLLGASCHFLFSSEIESRAREAKIFFKSILRGRFNGSLLTLPKLMFSALAVGVPMLWRYLRDNRVYNFTDGGIRLRVSIEQQQVRESGLVKTTGVDHFGLPKVALDWRIDGCEIETLAAFAELVRDFFLDAELGVLEIDEHLLSREQSFLSLVEGTNHQMGMARMSNDSQFGVVDRNLKVHGSLNLFIAGAAVFPSTGFANPTFTAIALGLRLSDAIQLGEV